jgi:hypothetical protein
MVLGGANRSIYVVHEWQLVAAGRATIQASTLQHTYSLQMHSISPSGVAASCSQWVSGMQTAFLAVLCQQGSQMCT